LARYEHLPIYREAYDLALHIEKIVRNFSRYHKYTLGTELRNKSRNIVEIIIKANNTEDRKKHLLELRQELETFKVFTRLCHDSGGFSSTKSYLHIAERITNIAKQNEGWIRAATVRERELNKGGNRGQNRKDNLSFPSEPVSSLCVRPADLPFSGFPGSEGKGGMIIQASVPVKDRKPVVPVTGKEDG